LLLSFFRAFQVRQGSVARRNSDETNHRLHGQGQDLDVNRRQTDSRRAGTRMMSTRQKKQKSDGSLTTLLEKLAAENSGRSEQPVMPEPVRTPLGIVEIDRALDPANSTGITVNALHEVRVETGLASASGAGFALLLGLIMARGKIGKNPRQELMNSTLAQTQPEPAPIPPVFWISDGYTRREYGAFYGPGLQVFGLSVRDLIRIYPESREETLWAAGEIAATPNAAAFCLIEITGHPAEIDLTATRRLMLRAQSSGTPVILLRQSGQEEASAAHTRWRVGPAASSPVVLTHKNLMGESLVPNPLQHQFIGPPAFTVTLEKCRGGHASPSTQWTLEWNRNEQRLTPSRSNGRSDDTIRGGSAVETARRSQAGPPGAALSFHPPAKARHRPDQASKTG